MLRFCVWQLTLAGFDSGASSATPRASTIQSSWRPPSTRRRIDRSEGIMHNGVDSRAASYSAVSSVTSTPRLPERRTSCRLSVQQSSIAGVCSHPLVQLTSHTSPAQQQLRSSANTDVCTGEPEELFFMPLPDTSDSLAHDADGHVEGEWTEARELSPLGRLPPTPDGRVPYSVAQPSAVVDLINGDGPHERASMPQPVSESTRKPLPTLYRNCSSFSVDGGCGLNENEVLADSPVLLLQSSLSRPTGEPVDVILLSRQHRARCIAPIVQPPPPPQSLDFCECCSAAEHQFLPQLTRQHALLLHTAARSRKPAAASGARVMDPGREIDPTRKYSRREARRVRLAPPRARLPVLCSDPPPEAIGEGQCSRGSMPSVDLLSVQSFEPECSACITDSGTSYEGQRQLPASRQVQAYNTTLCRHQHSGDLDSVGSAVLEPNAVNGSDRSGGGQPMLSKAATPTAVLVPIRGADGLLPPTAADGSIQYSLTHCGHTRTVLLTGDMDDDLDVLEELEDELGVQVHVQGLAPEASEVGCSSASSLDSESGGRSLGGLSFSPSMLSRKARRNAAGLQDSDLVCRRSALQALTGMQHASMRTVNLRLPMTATSTRSLSTNSFLHMSPQEGPPVIGVLRRTLSPEQAGTAPASPMALPARPVPRLSLQDVDVVALRANIEADAAAIQDDSLMLEPAVYGKAHAAPGVATAPPTFSSPPNSMNDHLGPLSAFEGSAIHAARGANFKSQRVYAQRSAQQARFAPTAGGTAARSTPATITGAIPPTQVPAAPCADFDYDTESNARLLYHDSEIHLAMLTLVLTLLLTSDGQLDPVHCPTDHVTLGAAQRSNDADLCTVMYHHLNHSRNQPVLAGLLQAAHAIGAPAVRLLKLLVHDLYSEELVTGKPETFARGTFALVQKRRASVVPSHRDNPACYIAEKVSAPPPVNHSTCTGFN